MEAVVLAPKSEVSIYPWKEPTERIPLAVIKFIPSSRHIGLL